MQGHARADPISGQCIHWKFHTQAAAEHAYVCIALSLGGIADSPPRLLNPLADYSAVGVPELRGLTRTQVQDALAGWREKARPCARPLLAALYHICQLSALSLRGALGLQAHRAATVSKCAPCECKHRALGILVTLMRQVTGVRWS